MTTNLEICYIIATFCWSWFNSFPFYVSLLCRGATIWHQKRSATPATFWKVAEVPRSTDQLDVTFITSLGFLSRYVEGLEVSEMSGFQNIGLICLIIAHWVLCAWFSSIIAHRHGPWWWADIKEVTEQLDLSIRVVRDAWSVLGTQHRSHCRGLIE